MKKILLLFLTFLPFHIYAQNTSIKGTVVDAETKEPIAGANITIKGKLIGTITDTNGSFTLSKSAKLPFELVISSIGYQKQEINLIAPDGPISVALIQKSEMIDEVVISASRVEENILKSPVSIEKLDLKSIRETPSLNFYT